MNYHLFFREKPVTTNRERAGNRWQRADSTKHWRAMAKEAAAHIPPMRAINVTAQPFQKRGRLQDTAACNPSVKAAIDGIVDAGVIPDDSGEYLPRIIFLPCKRGEDSLELIIEGEEYE